MCDGICNRRCHLSQELSMAYEVFTFWVQLASSLYSSPNSTQFQPRWKSGIAITGHCFPQQHGVYKLLPSALNDSPHLLCLVNAYSSFKVQFKCNLLVEIFPYFCIFFSFFHPSVNLSFFKLESILFLPLLWHLLFDIISQQFMDILVFTPIGL